MHGFRDGDEFRHIESPFQIFDALHPIRGLAQFQRELPL
jgi:hypothetical protein